MGTVGERLQSLWNSAKAGKAKRRASFKIPRDHVDVQLGPPFKPKEYYLRVVINEMFLANEREWFATYDPMVFAAGTYIYDKEYQSSPYVVGPSMLEEFGQEVPLGMIFRNTPVSGLHPYQGGSLTLTVMLSKLQRKNNADRLLKVVEGVSGAIDPSATFSTYLKIAETVMDGVEAILGLKETEPVAGFRTTIDPDIGNVLEPAYFALIDAEEPQIMPEDFWVRDGRLCYGQQLTAAEPYHQTDFVLFSIAQGDERHDERTLPFYALWEAAKDLAGRPEMHYWKEAKAQFLTLQRSLTHSPDLTEPDTERFIDTYFDQLKKIRERTVLASELAAGEPLAGKEIELARRSDALDALD